MYCIRCGHTIDMLELANNEQTEDWWFIRQIGDQPPTIKMVHIRLGYEGINDPMDLPDNICKVWIPEDLSNHRCGLCSKCHLNIESQRTPHPRPNHRHSMFGDFIRDYMRTRI